MVDGKRCSLAAHRPSRWQDGKRDSRSNLLSKRSWGWLAIQPVFLLRYRRYLPPACNWRNRRGSLSDTLTSCEVTPSRSGLVRAATSETSLENDRPTLSSWFKNRPTSSRSPSMSSSLCNNRLCAALLQSMSQVEQTATVERNTLGQILKSSALVGGSSVVNIAIGTVRSKAMAVLTIGSAFPVFLVKFDRCLIRD